MSLITTKDKRALFDWDEFIHNMNRSSPVDYAESPEDQRKRIKRLEADPEDWFKYYFETFCTHEPAPFHKRSTRRVLSHPEWYEVRPWSRELAKSGRTMMEVLYLTLTGKKKNVILTSNSFDNATRLLRPFKLLLEKNDRIIHDYGLQESFSQWSESEFVTRKKVAFRAIGAGQSPRGTRNEAARPDVLIIDDFDTDEDCRNPDTVDKKWEWLERAFYATRSISTPLLVIFCGNIIAEHCCIKKAIEMADAHEIVNIRDSKGRSTWPGKNTEELIDRALSKISYAAQQGEYFNNPISQGKVFKALNYKKTRPLHEYKVLVSYTDPSYKGSKKNDYKATALLGRHGDEYHVLKMFCSQTSTAEMLDWLYDTMKTVANKVPVYFFIEWPAIDEPIRLELDKANKKHGFTLPLRADDRTKPDKFFRIESLLEPLNREEKLWFNEELKTSQHMKATEAQFLALSPTSRAHDDAPDAVEGAVFKLNQLTIHNISKTVALPSKRTHKKRL